MYSCKKYVKKMLAEESVEDYPVKKVVKNMVK